MHDTNQYKVDSLKRNWLCYLAISLGIIIHGGTALLRLRTFFPSPALIDFSAFYASAAALRHGISPYGLPVEWLEALQTEVLLPGRPPAIYNPPLWPWLLQPLAALRYPFAAWVWVLCNLGLLFWVILIIQKRMTAESHFQPGRSIFPTLHLASITSDPFPVALILFTVIMTFGPVFLDLSIGQTSVLLLAMCVFIGLQTRTGDNWRSSLITGLAISLSAVAKLYPAAWIAPLALMRRWKQLVFSIFFTTAAFCAGFILFPDSNRVYWQQYLPQRLSSATDQVSMDDQSLLPWMDRLFRPHTYSVPGLQTGEHDKIVWAPRLTLDPIWVRIVGYGLSITLGIPVIYALVRSDQTLWEGGFYLWVLYILAVFPHMERYNHTLLLPAMVWLWQRGQQKLVAIVYLLAGLSRLNHLWITILPTPWGPLVSGFGLFAVFILMGGILAEFRHRRSGNSCLRNRRLVPGSQ